MISQDERWLQAAFVSIATPDMEAIVHAECYYSIFAWRMVRL
jgi:hypothetical protein